MSRFKGAVILAIGLAAGAAGGYWYARSPANPPGPVAAAQPATAAERHVLYYRDPSGAPYWSAIPKKDANGRDFLPVYEDEEVSFDPSAKKPQSTAAGSRRILYYRNPMGLPDTSPVPKKDWMGMDYIAVYEGEEQGDHNTVRVSLDKVQRSGVRTEKVQSRAVVRPVRAVGTMKTDESRVTVVAMRTEGYIEELFVSRTGQQVAAGEPLFRVYSSQIQQAQTDLLVAIHAQGASSLLGPSSLEGAMQRLRNLGVPESRIREVRAKGVNPRTVDWPAPASGHVIEKRVINGQRVMPGDELYRIADYSRVWVIADVSEADMAFVGIGTRAMVTFRSYPSEPVEGEVILIYPELKPETRTGRVRIELPNLDGRLKVDMYADVVFQDGAGEQFLAVPDSAVIDSGTRQIVLVARGEGRFEPRLVKLGPRGNGYVAILDGLTEGEEIVTAATFLIDAESNLRAALNAFVQQETTK
jgi:membrane fusion protein, copper/silver efflux system